MYFCGKVVAVNYPDRSGFRNRSSEREKNALSAKKKRFDPDNEIEKSK